MQFFVVWGQQGLPAAAGVRCQNSAGPCPWCKATRAGGRTRGGSGSGNLIGDRSPGRGTPARNGAGKGGGTGNGLNRPACPRNKRTRRHEAKDRGGQEAPRPRSSRAKKGKKRAAQMKGGEKHKRAKGRAHGKRKVASPTLRRTGNEWTSCEPRRHSPTSWCKALAGP
ncbi:unnamed protein product [Lota lota]